MKVRANVKTGKQTKNLSSFVMVFGLFVISLTGCQTIPSIPLPDIYTPPDDLEALFDAERQATPYGRKILEVGRRLKGRVIIGSCWDYVDEIYNRAGYPSNKRQTVFKSSRNGPYADMRLIQPGDWLCYINHSYRGIEHSAIFIKWTDYPNKRGLMLSYKGESRREPPRYLSYDLSHTYYIIRPKPD